jgi:hypothetical protein
MIRWVLGKILLGVESYWNDAVEQDDVRSFLQSGLESHVPLLLQWSRETDLAEACRGVLDAAVVAEYLGVTVPKRPEIQLDSVSCQSGCPEAPDACLERGRLVSGAAVWFESAVAEQPADVGVRSAAERLLRHVEVKRSNCLMSADQSLPIEQQCLDRYRCSVAFVRLSESTGDLRFLNAAMKINDWAIKSRQKLSAGQATAKLLLSVALQEDALRRVAECE